MKLNETSRVVWIDHHITAIQDSETFGYSRMPGLRVNGIAACELVWKYFWGDAPSPLAVQLVGSYDVWNHERFIWDEQILPLQYGLKYNFGINLKSLLERFDDVLEETEKYMDDGAVIYDYLKDLWKSWVKNYSFEVLVAGKYKGICIISPVFGSSCFESVVKDYDISIVVNKKKTPDGTETYQIGMYGEDTLDPEFSCGEYMKQFGGGGHRLAAGAQLTREQFQKLIFDNEI